MLQRTSSASTTLPMLTVYCAASMPRLVSSAHPTAHAKPCRRCAKYWKTASGTNMAMFATTSARTISNSSGAGHAKLWRGRHQMVPCAVNGPIGKTVA
ncbi:hypothetical protein [Streptomyces sp. GZWMJZ-114]|uniref:hypothetical protein n=1 Tax=Streptomyces sp. GZWMJZ-114 TaxID=2494734 RepID=UPI001F50CCE0|nr:hypothetical protein [Streptomyces sp. GZWMJZ-114]